MPGLTNKDRGLLALLALLALFIWTRDLRWVSSAADSLPIVLALPLFVWLVAPWRWRERAWQIEARFVAASAAGFLIGAALNLTWILAAAWCALLWGWLRERLSEPTRGRAFLLIPLPFLALPWVSLDGEVLGMAFRLSGAWVTENVFSTIGFNVVREGTLLSIQGAPISVEAACAGLNTLQSMLIAGVSLVFVVNGSSRFHWYNIALLIPLAWLANTVRIVILSGAAVSVSSEFATGTFHDLSGWLVIVTMFLICWGVMALEKRWIPQTKITS
jgi:exosortase